MSRKLWIGLLIVLVVEVGLAWKADVTLHIGEIPQWRFMVKEHEVVVNSRTLVTTWLVMGLLIVAAILVRRRLQQRPGRWQSVFELVVEFFDGLIRDTLGPGNRGVLPLIGSLFLFLWISNLIGVIPMLEEPTRDLNVPVGCMLVVLVVVHVSAMRAKGLKKYLRGYMQPFFIMFPLNVIGEMAKGVSLAFRLFGNILGGAIIILVISSLVRHILLPVGLSLFFGIFVGTIQAFVFTMLALTYIAVAVSE